MSDFWKVYASMLKWEYIYSKTLQKDDPHKLCGPNIFYEISK